MIDLDMLMDMHITQDLMGRNRAAASFIAVMKGHFQNNDLQIEDVEYEDLVPDPDDGPFPVLELVSPSINHRHG